MLRIAIELHAARDPGLRVRCLVRAQPDPGGRITGSLDVAAAVAADRGSFLHPPDAASCQVIRGEFATGLLSGGRGAITGWRVTLVELGATCGDNRDIAQAPGIAFAVAGTLIARHLAGAIDLRQAAHGGHGWRLAGCAVEEIGG